MRELIDIISKVAPTVGSLLGGPFGGALIDTIASTLGARPDQKAIIERISADPEVAKHQLITLEQQFRAEIARTQATQANMQLFYEAYRDDKDRGGFWSWARPAAAWVTITVFAAFAVILIRDLWQRQYAILSHLDLLVLFLVPGAAMAGVWFWQRTTERIAKINATTATEHSSIAQIVQEAVAAAMQRKK